MDGWWLSITIVSVFAAVAALLYHFVVRPWHLCWGTIGDETTRSLPGDDFVSANDLPITWVLTQLQRMFGRGLSRLGSAVAASTATHGWRICSDVE